MKNFADLMNDLRQEDIFKKLGPELALMVPNRWDYLVNWAKKKGYEFTPADIKQYITLMQNQPFISTYSQTGVKPHSHIHGKWDFNTLP